MKRKFLLPAILLVAVLVLAGAGYKLLSADYTPASPADGTSTDSPEPDISVQEELEETPPAQEEEDAASDADNEEAGPLPAQDFIVLDQAGEIAYLSDRFGKPVVLNFWATWCGPCESELPAFQSAYETYGEDVNFMMINLDGDQEAVEDYLAENGYTFPVYYDTTSSAAYSYGAYSIPLTVFIDKDGYVVTGYIGAIPGELLEGHIAELLGIAE